MKANFLCFKLSKTIIGLIIIISIQLIFIIIGIKEIRETKSFEQMKVNINNITDEKKQPKEQKLTSNKNVDYNKKENTTNQNIKENYKIEKNVEEQIIKNKTILKEELEKETNKKEYETMPQEEKGFKVIRKNYNT